jgi:hypothetical protein
MARLGRRGRILRWAGLIVSLVILLTWALSVPWAWKCIVSRQPAAIVLSGAGYRYRMLIIHQGCGVWHDFRTDASPWSLSFGGRFSVEHYPAYPRWLPEAHPGFGSAYYLLPLWMPFLFFAIPTGVLWYRDRRRIPAGHCRKCGYNLTGNLGGVCPECGEKVMAAVRPPGSGQ